jgi:peptidoglycan/LPS O-acetylase OafA/YrhL
MGNALEGMRIAATFFVLFYHAALSYVATPLRLTLWASYDAAGHGAFDYLVYWVNGFAMPVFFLAAGVSAPAACASRGPRVFLTSRVRRLLRPLLFGCLTVLPFFYLVWGYALLVTGGIVLDDILRWRFSPAVSHELYGLGHFWFLEYLFVVSVVWCGGWTLRSYVFRGAQRSTNENAAGEQDEGWVARLLGSRWRPLLFAIPTGLIFCIDSDTMLRVDNVIVPNVARVVHYAYFFTVGGWLSKTRDPRGRYVPWSTLYLVLSFVVFGLMSPLLLRHAAEPLAGWARIVYCGLGALFPWLAVFGALGVFMRLFQGRGTVMRYLAESSFWVYIIHVPVIALAQVLLLPLPWPPVVKFVLVAMVAIVLSLLSYEYIVRRSLVGEIINGSRKRSPKRGLFGPELGWVATLAVVAATLAIGAWCSRVFFFQNNLHEEAGGRFYRSARLSTGDLDEVIRRARVQTVLTFTGGSQRHPWYLAQKQVCQAHGVALVPFNLPADRAPRRAALLELLGILARSPRPLLVEGNRGLDQSAFTVALGEMLGGTPPREALRQFRLKYGQFGGPEHSPLGRVVLAYQTWLQAHGWRHSAARLTNWAQDEYLVHALPAAPGAARLPTTALTRGMAAATVTR